MPTETPTTNTDNIISYTNDWAGEGVMSAPTMEKFIKVANINNYHDISVTKFNADNYFPKFELTGPKSVIVKWWCKEYAKTNDVGEFELFD